MPFLDLAFRENILPNLAPDKALGSPFADVLFSGAQPSVTNFSEKLSFPHYLQCLSQQCKQASRSTYKETFNSQTLQLESAEKYISLFHDYGVRGQNRDYSDFVDVGRSAISVLDKNRGFVLDRTW